MMFQSALVSAALFTLGFSAAIPASTETFTQVKIPDNEIWVPITATQTHFIETYNVEYSAFSSGSDFASNYVLPRCKRDARCGTTVSYLATGTNGEQTWIGQLYEQKGVTCEDFKVTQDTGFSDEVIYTIA